jgi:archaellum component FlaC
MRACGKGKHAWLRNGRRKDNDMEKESRNRCIYALLEALMDRMDDIEGAVEDLSEEIDGFGQAIYEPSAEIENIS